MTDAFNDWFHSLCQSDQSSVLAGLMVLRIQGPQLSRPYADTVKGSRYSNMKELRVQSRGNPLRVFFAFDPQRVGILLCAGNKTGYEKRFYDMMIPIADREYMRYLRQNKNKESLNE